MLKMNIVITLTVLAATRNFVITETKEGTKELYPKSTVSTTKNNHVSTNPTSATTYSAKFDPKVNSLWKLYPSSQNSETAVNNSLLQSFRPPMSLTRITKTRNHGFDPYFNKGYFEPFEARPKPITLVAFRKNGLMPRHSTRVKASTSSEAAELQSPYNDIGHFWQDDFGQS